MSSPAVHAFESDNVFPEPLFFSENRSVVEDNPCSKVPLFQELPRFVGLVPPTHEPKTLIWIFYCPPLSQGFFPPFRE